MRRDAWVTKGRSMKRHAWGLLTCGLLLGPGPILSQEVKLRATFKGHTDSVTSVAFTADGKSIVSGSWDKTIKLWEVTTGKDRLTFKGHSDYVTAVALSEDGRLLASGSYDRTVKLWDASTGK